MKTATYVDVTNGMLFERKACAARRFDKGYPWIGLAQIGHLEENLPYADNCVMHNYINTIEMLGCITYPVFVEEQANAEYPNNEEFAMACMSKNLDKLYLIVVGSIRHAEHRHATKIFGMQCLYFEYKRKMTVIVTKSGASKEVWDWFMDYVFVKRKFPSLATIKKYTKKLTK